MKYFKLMPASFLFLSGLLITTVSAFLSIKGFLLFLPNTELYLGLFGLGIAFELAKITVSTFLFHRMKDKTFPFSFKVLMFICVLSLIIFSSIFSFVHLNASASASFSENNINKEKIEILLERNNDIQNSIVNIEKQFESIPSNVITARMKLYEKLNPEKEKLSNELQKNLEEINSIKNSSLNNDQFKFLVSISELLKIDKEKIFSTVILFIVIIIDPLAISLFLSASHILNSHKEEIKESNTIEKPLEQITVNDIVSTPELLKDADINTDGKISNEEKEKFIESKKEEKIKTIRIIKRNN